MTDNVERLERTLPIAQPAREARQRLRELVREGAVALGMLLLVLALNAPFFQLPFFWDSSWIAVGTEHILENGFSPILPAGWDFGHPVLLLELLALAWLVLGRAMWVSHLVIVGFAFLTVYFTFRVGQLLYGRRVGLVAAVLLLFYPMFWAQSTVIYLELPTAVCTIMAVYFLLGRKTFLYVLTASAMVLMKASGALLIPAVWLYLLARDSRRASWRGMLIVLAVHSLPIFVLAGWFWYHRWATGWLAAPENLGWLIPANYGPNKGPVRYLLSMLFGRGGVLLAFLRLSARYFGSAFLTGILTLFIAVCSFSIRPFLRLDRRRFSWQGIWDAFRAQPFWQVWEQPENLMVLGLPALLYLLLVAVATDADLHRYLLPVYPLFFVLAARAIEALFPQKHLMAVVTTGVVVIFAVFALGWALPWFGYSRRMGYELESPATLTYADFVETHQAAAAFLESDYPDKTVLTDWPAYVELSTPVEGYVTRPLKIIAHGRTPGRQVRISAMGGRYFLDLKTLTLDDFDLVYYSSLPDYYGRSELLDIVERFQLPLIAEFRKNGEYVAIYANPETIDGSVARGR